MKDAFDFIREEIARVSADERLSYPPADVTINAPLALIQVALKSRIQALQWLHKQLIHGSNK